MREVILFLALASGCQQTRPHATSSAALPSSVSAAPAVSGDARAALDQLDRRARVPLLPMMAHHQKQNMRDHLLVVLEVVMWVV